MKKQEQLIGEKNQKEFSSQIKCQRAVFLSQKHFLGKPKQSSQHLVEKQFSENLLFVHYQNKKVSGLTSTASVPLSIRSIFVRTPNVLSPEKSIPIEPRIKQLKHQICS